MRNGPPLKWASNVSLWNCFEAVKKSLWSKYAKVVSKLILIPIWMNGSGTRPFNFDPWMGKHHEITWTKTLGHIFLKNRGFTLFYHLFFVYDKLWKKNRPIESGNMAKGGIFQRVGIKFPRNYDSSFFTTIGINTLCFDLLGPIF